MADGTEPSAPSEEALPEWAKRLVRFGDLYRALCEDAANREKFYASMGPNFEAILSEHVARAVAAERERCLRIIREELAAARVGSVRGSIASIANAIWRGEG